MTPGQSTQDALDGLLAEELGNPIKKRLAIAAARTAALKKERAGAKDTFDIHETANQARALKFEMNGYGVSMSFVEAVHAVSSKKQEN